MSVSIYHSFLDGIGEPPIQHGELRLVRTSVRHTFVHLGEFQEWYVYQRHDMAHGGFGLTCVGSMLAPVRASDDEVRAQLLRGDWTRSV